MKRDNYYSGRSGSLLGGVDWVVILVYITLVMLGWISIYAAVYNEDHASMFDMSQKYGSQIFWIGVCSGFALVILLVDSKYYHYLSYPSYIFMILVLFGVLIGGTTVNGAKAWITIGSFRIQPAEFAKVATTLALAKYMSTYSFDIRTLKGVLSVGAIIAVPALIIIIQNDTGSALVFGAFLIMFYREGLNIWLYTVLFLMITIFILSFIIEPIFLLYILFLAMLFVESKMNGYVVLKISYAAAVTLLFMALVGLNVLFDWQINSSYLFVITVALSIGFVILYMYRIQAKNVIIPLAVFVGSTIYLFSVEYVFNSIMKIHQQKRILDLLGLESDVKNWGYNVNQSKIAIGSGGFSGKGFLNGTQTKYNFVPEQSTDFIFCTISEELGFVGSFFVVTLFVLLIIRLMQMGDRQNDAFGRIYCYGAASIFTFHVLVNIGMTIGVMPVIGIPLPFFSYGGSSLLAFTVLLFIAVKLDTDRNDTMNNFYV